VLFWSGPCFYAFKALLCRGVYVYVSDVHSELLFVHAQFAVYEIKCGVFNGFKRQYLSKYTITAGRRPFDYQNEVLVLVAHLPYQLLDLKMPLYKDHHLQRKGIPLLVLVEVTEDVCCFVADLKPFVQSLLDNADGGVVSTLFAYLFYDSALAAADIAFNVYNHFFNFYLSPRL